MKKTLAIILTICMVMSLLPTFALAGTPTVREVSNAADLATAVSEAAAGDTIKLTANVTLTGELTINKDLTLNLNGKPIDTAGHLIKVTAGHLTVTGNGNLNSTVYSTGADRHGMFRVESGANLTIENGTFDTKGTEIVKTLGTALIKGGTFTCSREDAGTAYDGYCIMVSEGTSARLTVEAGTLSAIKGIDYCGMNGVYSLKGGTIILGKPDGTGPSITTDYSAIGANNTTATCNFTIYGGTYTIDTNGNASNVINNKYNTVVYMPCEGTYNISGGTFKATGSNSHVFSIPYTMPDITLNITGGSFGPSADLFYIGNEAGSYGTNSGDNISISGGEFKTAPDDAYIASGKEVMSTGNATYPYAVGTPEASIGDTKYATLAGAVAAAGSGDTIKLGADITLSDTLAIDGKTFTLDLNGKTITCNPGTKKTAINIGATTASTITIMDSGTGGKITSSTLSVNYNLIAVRVGSTLNFQGGDLEVIMPNPGDYAKAIQNQGTLTVTGGSITAPNGIYTEGATTVNFQGGTINASNAGIIGHGTDKTGNGTINVSGGTITSPVTGIYHPQAGTLNISGTASITGGENGIGIKSGALNITGGTVSCTGPNTAPTNGFSNGINGSGAAIQIESNSDYAGGVDVDITGGTITSANGSSIYEYIGKGDATDVTDFDISGGKFKGGIVISAELAAASGRPVISGGDFTADPLAYLASGYFTKSAAAPYKYTVTNVAPSAEPVIAPPAIALPVVDAERTLDEDETQLANAAATAAADTTMDSSAEETLRDLAADEADDVNVEQALADPRVSSLPEIDPSASPNLTPVVVQPYMEIKVVDAIAPVGETTPATLTLDITPMSQTYVTRAQTVKDGDELVTGDEGQNAIAVGAPQKLTVPETIPVTLTVGIPASMAVAVTPATDPVTFKPLTIKHQKDNGQIYYYDAVVTKDSQGNKYFATFIVTHGFSKFTLMAADERELEVTYDSDVAEVTYKITDVGKALPSATPESGYTFSGWKFDGVTGTYKTLPDIWAETEASPIKVNATAQFTATPSGPSGTSYTVTVSAAENGKVTADKTTAAEGDTVTLTITPAEGYALDTLTVKDKDDKAVTVTDKTFKMPASDVTVTATFKTAKWVNPFDDVKDTDWFYDDVAYAYAEELMNGVSDTEFDPHGVTTRGMIVTILYRMAGEPNIVAANPFKDVADGMYYTKPVIWAAENDIVNGYSADTFGPNDPITREQMATILFRYAKFRGQTVSQAADLSKFTDADKISSWAVDAMKWAVAKELIQGDGTALNPGGNAERCQVAAIFHRFGK